MLSASLDFLDHFSNVDEPRIERTKIHGLIDILFISVAGTIAGCDGPTDIASFAKTQLAWCRKFVKLKNGVPSHDTIGRVISLVKPHPRKRFLIGWLHWQRTTGRMGPGLSRSTGRRCEVLAARNIVTIRFMWSALGLRNKG
jgi:hypothetical protein